MCFAQAFERWRHFPVLTSVPVPFASALQHQFWQMDFLIKKTSQKDKKQLSSFQGFHGDFLWIELGLKGSNYLACFIDSKVVSAQHKAGIVSISLARGDSDVRFMLPEKAWLHEKQTRSLDCKRAGKGLLTDSDRAQNWVVEFAVVFILCFLFLYSDVL